MNNKQFSELISTNQNAASRYPELQKVKRVETLKNTEDYTVFLVEGFKKFNTDRFIVIRLRKWGNVEVIPLRRSGATENDYSAFIKTLILRFKVDFYYWSSQAHLGFREFTEDEKRRMEANNFAFSWAVEQTKDTYWSEMNISTLFDYFKLDTPLKKNHLKVILDNGEEITARRIRNVDLEKKLIFTTFEYYRPREDNGAAINEIVRKEKIVKSGEDIVFLNRGVVAFTVEHHDGNVISHIELYAKPKVKKLINTHFGIA